MAGPAKKSEKEEVTTIRTFVEKPRKTWTKPAVRWLEAHIASIKRSPNQHFKIRLKDNGRLSADDVAGYFSQNGILAAISKDSDCVEAVYEVKEKK